MACVCHCAIVVIISFLVNCGISLNVTEHDKEELDEYAKEVNRLFNDLPEFSNTSEETLLKDNDLESVPYVRSYSDSIISSEERRMAHAISGEVTKPSELPETIIHDLPSFTISNKINSSTTRNRSQVCLPDRRNITAIFRECIYIQAKLTTTVSQTSSLSEPSARDHDAQFLKYCRKAPQLRSCVKNMIVNKMEHCLDEGVRETVNNIEEITERIIKFICIKEADRISIFISDGGLECLVSSNWRMHMCLSVNLGSYLLLSLFELPSLNLQNIKCINLQSAQKCVARELEMCEDQASAVVAKLLFDIAMEVASCDEFLEGRVTTLSSGSLKLSSLSSLRDGEPKTKDTRNLKQQLSAELGHVHVTEFNSSLVISSQEPHFSSRMTVPSVASKDYPSTSNRELEGTQRPPNNVTNATMYSNHNSAATKLGLMCELLIFSAIIITSYNIYS